ncbi:NADP-dependent oxidoreductase [Marinibactrum halimedae]|uniref:NADP-dependent oxidoreductase n=1 Tax=Marinibactrum halimedae TaxID=1444977 RepID=A0AA37T3L4_9GAMM|nr:NADP-dependent oxidoreductase [Marinibactrum halimedae]MCD9457770.1 NADP-dependent oxidoreductase [Marinibactrum halimedae]GLS24856.1 NADP-dependent oxidoreductase [Marinibactrum halimedae]
MSLVNRQWLLANRPAELVSRDNFEYKETPVPDLKEGEFLIKNLYLSFDPTLRVWMNEADSYVSAIEIGEVMRASTVAQVVDSKNDAYPKGEFLVGMFGWQDYMVTDGTSLMLPPRRLPAGTPLTMPLSIFGITGITAYFGMKEIGQVKEGDVVVVSGAAGATGSVAAQIARLKGATVIGIAGGEEKCQWLKESAKLHHTIDYKSENIAERLKELCPKGIDVYYDNVGGDLLDTVLSMISINARIVLCGAISDYNSKDTYALKNYTNLIVQRGTMQGFIILDYLPRSDEAIGDLLSWVQSGELVYQEDIQEGLENAPEAFQRIFTGKNKGKQLLKVADPE